MNKRMRLTVAATLAIAAVALATGTGSFSMAQLDRETSVSTSDSGDAIISLADPGAQDTPDWAEKYEEPEVTESKNKVPIFFVWNRFDDTTLSVSATQHDGSDVVSDVSSESVDSGDEVPVKGTVDCVGGYEAVILNVTAHTMDGSISTIIKFEVTVDCKPDLSSTPTRNPTSNTNTTS